MGTARVAGVRTTGGGPPAAAEGTTGEGAEDAGRAEDEAAAGMTTDGTSVGMARRGSGRAGRSVMSTTVWRGEGRETPEPVDGDLERGSATASDTADACDAEGTTAAEAPTRGPSSDSRSVTPAGRASTTSQTWFTRLGARRTHSEVANGRSSRRAASWTALTSASSVTSSPISAPTDPRSHYRKVSKSVKEKKSTTHHELPEPHNPTTGPVLREHLRHKTAQLQHVHLVLSVDRSAMDIVGGGRGLRHVGMMGSGEVNLAARRPSI